MLASAEERLGSRSHADQNGRALAGGRGHALPRAGQFIFQSSGAGVEIEIHLVPDSGRMHHVWQFVGIGRQQMRNLAGSGRAFRGDGQDADGIQTQKSHVLVSVRLHSASPISDEARKALERLVAQNNQEVDFENRTDERMIGGFVLEIEDLRLDASVSSQLNDIKLGLLRR